MASRDLVNNVKATSVMVPLLRTTTFTSAALDQQGYESATVLLHVGAVTDGTYTPKLQESATTTSGDFTDVAAGNLLASTLAAITSGTASGTVQKVGYIGTLRYIRLVVTASGSPSTGGNLSSTVLLAHSRRVPLA